MTMLIAFIACDAEPAKMYIFPIILLYLGNRLSHFTSMCFTEIIDFLPRRLQLICNQSLENLLHDLKYGMNQFGLLLR